MKIQSFEKFWEAWTKEWINTAQCCDSEHIDERYYVHEKCRIKPLAVITVYKRYQKLKARAKGAYFYLAPGADTDTIRLSRYKRGAVIIQAVLSTDCLEYFDGLRDDNAYFLKERLAFFLGIASIIQSFPREDIQALLESSNEPLYQFNQLDIDRKDDADDFTQSVYKDLFYSRILGNYNILTMANLLGVLTERASSLSQIIKPAHKAE